MSKKLKPRDKITQKMSRDGLIEVNETAGTAELVSGREQDADFSKQPEQAAQEAAQQLPHPSGSAAARPHTPELSPKRDDAAAERVLEHIDAAHTRTASKKAIKRAQREAAAKTKTSRLQFTEEERATPELQKAIRKSERAADRLDEARAAIPKKKVLTKERTFDEAAGKGKTRLRFEEKKKPIPGGRQQHNPLSRPVQEVGVFVHNKIHSVEKDNSGVEGAHKSEELAERGIRAGARQMRKSRRSRKLKPYRAAAKAEKAAFKANADFQYQKALHNNPQLAASNPVSRFWQKQQIKRQYAKAVRTGGAKSARKAAENTRKAAKKTAEATKKTAAFVGRHWKAFLIAGCALLLFIMISAGMSSCSSLFSGGITSVISTSYVSEDADMLGAEADYAALEAELQSRIDNIERDHPGYDEYRYDLDDIEHDPYVLTSILTALHLEYARAEVQSTLAMLFERQYTLTLTEETEVRYRTERRTGTYTDAEGNTQTCSSIKCHHCCILLIRSTLFLRRWLGKNNKSAQNFHQGRFVPELAAGSRDPCIDIIDGGPVEICNLNRLISLQLQLNGLDAFPSNTLVLLLTGAQRCHSGIVSDLGLEVNGGMGKQIKEYLALFKTCIYTSLESVIHRTAVIDNGIVDIATCEGCEFAAIRLVLQSGTADGLTTDGIEVIIGQ